MSRQQSSPVHAGEAHPENTNLSSPVPQSNLLAWVGGGVAEVAQEIYSRYGKSLQALARRQRGYDLRVRFDSEDVVQSVFRKFFLQVDREAYEAMPASEVWRLLATLAVRTVRSKAAYHRAGKRDVRREVSETGLDHQEHSVAQDGGMGATFRLEIEEMLEGLAPFARTTILLRMQEYRVDEIARMTNRSRRSVERVLQEFRAIVKEQS